MKVLILGVTGSIGQRLAKMYADDGHEVWGVGRQRDSDIAIRLAHRFTYVDFEQEDQWRETSIELANKSGGFDIILGSSAAYDRKSLSDVSVEDLKTIFVVNSAGPCLFIRDILASQEGPCTVVFFNSSCAFQTSLDLSGYSSSKAAQMVLAKNMAQANKGSNKAVATVILGPIWDDNRRRLVDKVKEKFDLAEDQAIKMIMSKTSDQFLIDEFVKESDLYQCLQSIQTMSNRANGIVLRLDGGEFPGIF